MKKFSFPPLQTPNAHTLILGSMPGEASLDVSQYYAHPRNHFWPFMDSILGVDYALPYEQRCDALIKLGFAVWDVLRACVREGSLDSRIQSDSIETNDFRGFFTDHPGITRVFLNGGKAEQLYLRKVRPCLLYTSPSPRDLSTSRMPSSA